jgi:hypothetical protein
MLAFRRLGVVAPSGMAAARRGASHGNATQLKKRDVNAAVALRGCIEFPRCVLVPGTSQPEQAATAAAGAAPPSPSLSAGMVRYLSPPTPEREEAGTTSVNDASSAADERIECIAVCSPERRRSERFALFSSSLVATADAAASPPDPARIAADVAARVDAALATRRRLSMVPSPRADTAFRAVHGASDGLAGCFVNVFGKTALMEVVTSGARAALQQPLSAALEAHGYSVHPCGASVTAGDPPPIPKDVPFHDTGAAYATPARHDLAARGARRVVASLVDRLLVAQQQAAKKSPPAAMERVLCIGTGTNGAFALTALATAAATAGGGSGGSASSAGGDGTRLTVKLLEGCPVSRRIIAANVQANVDTGAIAESALEVVPVPEKTRVDVTAEHLDDALGPNRQFSLAVVEIRDWHEVNDASFWRDVDLTVAASARVKAGGHLLVWYHPWDVRCARVASEFLTRLSPRLTRAWSGVMRTPRLISTIPPPTDFLMQLPGPNVAVAADGTMAMEHAKPSQQHAAADVLRNGDAPIGWLFFVE